jgi:REP element-mobilizing transposase RayT
MGETMTHNRRSIRLKGYDYTQPGAYFVTICVQNHECMFGNVVNGEMMLNEWGIIVKTIWDGLPQKYTHIDINEYIIMPNHFHGIITVGARSARPATTTTTRPAITTRPQTNTDGETGRADPAITTRPQTNTDGETGRADPAPTMGQIVAYFKYQTTKLIDAPTKLWQRNYFEHIIRDDAEYQRIADYIQNNPLNWQIDKFNEA